MQHGSDRVADDRRATAQDVADLAGVSRSTVSLVLNGRADGNISATKQVQVIEAARQLSYRPNAVALSLRSQRSWAIGALTWRGAAGFPEGMLHASWHTAKAAGYLLMIMDTNDDREHEALAVASLLDRQVDAVVVVAPDLTEYRPPEALAQTPTVVDQLPRPRSHGGQHRARRGGGVGQRRADLDRSRPFPDRVAGRRHGHDSDRATDRRRAGRRRGGRHPAAGDHGGRS